MLARILRRGTVAAALIVMAGAGRTCEAELLPNGGFQSGDLTGWAVFTSLDGTNGPGLPAVTSFDVTGLGARNAAGFQVGSKANFPFLGDGGGLSQDFRTPGGTLELSADVAAYAKFGGGSEGGMFFLSVDDGFVGEFDSGPISAGQVIRSHLTGTVYDVTPGIHTFGIEVVTTEKAAADTPLQFVTNLGVTPLSQPAVPEPSAFYGAAVAVASGLVFAGLRRRASSATRGSRRDG